MRTYPQCRPITSSTKVRWWLQRQESVTHPKRGHSGLGTIRVFLSPLRRGGDGVHNLHDAVQRRVGTDGHVSAAEVVVDGAHHAHDVQVARALSLLRRDATWGSGGQEGASPPDGHSVGVGVTGIVRGENAQLWVTKPRTFV